MKVTPMDWKDNIVCPGCGKILSKPGPCTCGYENPEHPRGKLPTIAEMLEDSKPYNDVRMDLLLKTHTAQLKRLEEMEYAVDAGNIAKEDIPWQALHDWLHYVRVG